MMAVALKHEFAVACFVVVGLAAVPGAVAPSILTWDYEHAYEFDWTTRTLTSTSITGTIDFQMECTHGSGWYVSSETGSPIEQPDTLTLSANEANLEFQVRYVKGASTHAQVWRCDAGQTSAYNPDDLPTVTSLGSAAGSTMCSIGVGTSSSCSFTCVKSTVSQTHYTSMDAVGIVGTATVSCAGNPVGTATCTFPSVVGGVTSCHVQFANDMLQDRTGTCSLTGVVIAVVCDGDA